MPFCCSCHAFQNSVPDEWVWARTAGEVNPSTWLLCDTCAQTITASGFEEAAPPPIQTPQTQVLFQNPPTSFSVPRHLVSDATLFKANLKEVFGENAEEFSPELRERLMCLWEKGLHTISQEASQRFERAKSGISSGSPVVHQNFGREVFPFQSQQPQKTCGDCGGTGVQRVFHCQTCVGTGVSG